MTLEDGECPMACEECSALNTPDCLMKEYFPPILGQDYCSSKMTGMTNYARQRFSKGNYPNLRTINYATRRGFEIRISELGPNTIEILIIAPESDIKSSSLQEPQKLNNDYYEEWLQRKSDMEGY